MRRPTILKRRPTILNRTRRVACLESPPNYHAQKDRGIRISLVTWQTKFETTTCEANL